VLEIFQLYFLLGSRILFKVYSWTGSSKEGGLSKRGTGKRFKGSKIRDELNVGGRERSRNREIRSSSKGISRRGLRIWSRTSGRRSHRSNWHKVYQTNRFSRNRLNKKFKREWGKWRV
jgi:hypothetical protein